MDATTIRRWLALGAGLGNAKARDALLLMPSQIFLVPPVMARFKKALADPKEMQRALAELGVAWDLSGTATDALLGAVRAEARREAMECLLMGVKLLDKDKDAVEWVREQSGRF